MTPVGFKPTFDPNVDDGYPSRDGNPMSDHMLQYDWIAAVEGNLSQIFLHRPDVLVAANLLWYPVEGRVDIRICPDVMVAFGRGKEVRGSYRQWREAGTPVHVVFEILSPGNTDEEMARKLEWYERYGAEEVYYIDPFAMEMRAWVRAGDHLEQVENVQGWVSPRLGIRFTFSDYGNLILYRPDGKRFESRIELALDRERQEREAKEQSRRAQEEHRRAEEERGRAEEEHRRAEEERRRAEAAEAKAARLLEQLRKLGIDPDAPAESG